MNYYYAQKVKEKTKMDKISHDTYQDIVENIAEGIRVLNQDGIIIYANNALCSLMGYERSELIGKSVYDFYPSEDHSLIEKHLKDREAGKSARYETRYINKSGDKLFAGVSAVPIFDKTGEYQGNYTLVRDITERKKLEQQILNEKNFLDNLIALCPDGIIGVNRKGIIIIFNQAAEALTGYTAKEAIGVMHITDIYNSTETAHSIKKKIYSDDFGGQGRLEGLEIDVINRLGRKTPIRLSATLIYNNGEEVGSVGFFHDLSKKKQMEARLRELSITDSLSGLYNQRYFYSVLKEETERSLRYKHPLSMICFDLDHFKQCNDKLGHLEGDNIIRLVGQTLKQSLRKTDMAFRYGGDEFMVILPETALPGAKMIAERIRSEFNGRWPFEIVCERKDVSRVTLSVGIAIFNPEEAPETFVKRADLAMYEAKQSGGDKVVEAISRIGRQDECEIYL